MIVGQIFLKPNIRITLPTTDTKWDSIIENNNRWKDLYISVYNFHNDPKGYNAIVDKIFLDFDPIGNDDEISYTNCQTVVQYLRSENVAHNVLYSGRGFHILIDLDTSIILNNPKQAIRNYVTEMYVDMSQDNPDIILKQAWEATNTFIEPKISFNEFCKSNRIVRV